MAGLRAFELCELRTIPSALDFELAFERILVRCQADADFALDNMHGPAFRTATSDKEISPLERLHFNRKELGRAHIRLQTANSLPEVLPEFRIMRETECDGGGREALDLLAPT